MCTMQLGSVLIVCFQGDLCMIVGPVGSGKVRNKNLFGLHVSPKTIYLFVVSILLLPDIHSSSYYELGSAVCCFNFWRHI